MTRLAGAIKPQTIEAIAKRVEQPEDRLVALVQGAPIAPGQYNAISRLAGFQDVGIVVGTDGGSDRFEDLG